MFGSYACSTSACFFFLVEALVYNCLVCTPAKNTKSKRKRLWRAAGGTSHEIIQFHEVMRKQTREWVVSSPQHANFKSFEDANPAVGLFGPFRALNMNCYHACFRRWLG